MTNNAKSGTSEIQRRASEVLNVNRGWPSSPRLEAVITLRRKEDFDRLFQAGTRYRNDLLETVVYFRSDGKRPRVAFVVGTKVDKRTVVRNRIRRRMRQAWRREMASVKDGVDVAFIARTRAAKASYHEIADVVCRHLHKAGVIG